MFLQSIKLCGVFGCKGAKIKEFRYGGENLEEDYTNLVTDQRFIRGFLLIFDRETSTENVISANHQGEAYVEVCLRQKDENTYSHDWLGKGILKIKRSFQPKASIFINSKRCEINSFYQSLKNIGFQNINNLCIHRLLDDDIQKISRFMGDEYWKMLTKVIEHEELIEIVEQKAGVVKKMAMQRIFNIVVDTVKHEIPKKLELKKTLYQRIQMNKHFFTLFYIILERKNAVLEALGNDINKKVTEKVPIVHQKLAEDERKRKSQELLHIKIGNSKARLDDIKEKFIECEAITEMYKGEPDANLLTALADSFANLTTLKKEDFAAPNFSDDDLVNREIAAVKFCLAESAGTNRYEDIKEQLQTLNDLNEKFINILGSDEASATIIEDGCIINNNLAAQLEQGFLQEICAPLDNFSAVFREADEKLYQLSDFAIDLEMSNQELHSFINIETAIMSCTEDVRDDYLGPVFQYLDGTQLLGMECWEEIEPIVKTILFKTSASLKTFLTGFSTKNLVNVTFSSLDKIDIKRYDVNIHDSNNLISMKTLVVKGLERKLRDAILTLLYDILVTYDRDFYPTKELKNFRVVVRDNNFKTTKHRGMVEISNVYTRKWNALKINPLKHIQDFYKAVKEFVLLDAKKFSGFETMTELETKKYDLLSEQVDAVCNKTKIGKDEDRLKVDKAIFEKTTELLTMSEEDCVNLDVDELKEEMRRLGFLELANDYNSHINQLISVNGAFVQQVRSVLSKFLSEADPEADANGRVKEVSNSETFKKIATKKDEFEELMNEQLNIVKSLYDSVEIFLEDCEKEADSNNEIKDLIADSVLNDLITAVHERHMEDIIDEKTEIISFKKQLYEEKLQEDLEKIKDEAEQVFNEMRKAKKFTRIDLKSLDPQSYNHLALSLGKVEEYSKKDIYAPMKVKKRAYPLMNVVIIKVLKDTVYNFTATYNAILSDYITRSHLNFYTTNGLNETDDESFSWNCFDITRLKAIDFVEKWKNENCVLSPSCRQLIKSLLLILHIINYISIFKFVVISEKVFEGMDPPLENKLRNFLKNISPFVQIILYKEGSVAMEEETLREPTDMIQPMDTSDIDVLE